MTKYYSNKSDFESGSGTTTSAGTGYMNYGGYGDQTGDTQVTNLLKDIKEVTQVVQDEGVSDLYKQTGEASLGKDMPSNTFTTSYNRAEKLLDLAKRVHGEVLERIDGKFTKGIDESLKSLNKVNGSDKPYKTKNLTYQKSIPYTDENGNLYYYQQTETYTLSELLDQKASPIKSTQKVYKEKLKQFRDKINNATDMSAKEIEKYKKMSDKELMATFYHGQISNYSGLKHFKWQEDNKEWLEPVEKYLGIGLFAVSAVATVFSFGTTSPALAATAAFVATTSGTMGTTYSLVDGGYSAITGNTLISGTELDFDDRVWAAAEAFASVSSFGVGKAFKFAGAADDTLAKVAKTTGVVEDTVNLSHIGYNAVVKGEDPTLSLVTFAGGKVVGDISKRAEAKWKNSGSQNGNIDAVTSPKDLSTIKGKNVDTDVPVKPHVDVETSKIKPVEAVAGAATAVPKSKKPDIDVLTKPKDLSTIKGEAVEHVGTTKPKVELDVPEVKEPTTREIIDSKLQEYGVSWDEFNRLRNTHVTKMTPSEYDMMLDIRNTLPKPDTSTVMQKIMPIDAEGWMFNQEEDATAGGYVAKRSDVKNITNIHEAVEGLRLDYEGSPFVETMIDSNGNRVAVRDQNGNLKLKTDAYLRLEYTTDETGYITIPYGDMDGNLLDKDGNIIMDSKGKPEKVIDPASGNGFIKSDSDEFLVPEYRHSDRSRLKQGSKLYLNVGGEEVLVGIVGEDGKMVYVKG
ncbi:hypothetical protein [Streptococcus parasanguinis]|mgnify:CR=1 FL=1|jgi:hypothetical protein|uniref:hypothetical protein n=2 Tax=Bacteria TaxID=2 RepID=UPI00189A1BE1|nr:hypothetical protein [Streptococcus parasanguinis]